MLTNEKLLNLDDLVKVVGGSSTTELRKFFPGNRLEFNFNGCFIVTTVTNVVNETSDGKQDLLITICQYAFDILIGKTENQETTNETLCNIIKEFNCRVILE